MNGFNPSVGILFVHTAGRGAHNAGSARVSIPRSGFCLFIHGSSVSLGRCSIWFQSLGRDSVCSYPAVSVNFTVSVKFQSLGRDSVCSYCHHNNSSCLAVLFQSLGRDSVCSYLNANPHHALFLAVSIPRSGFCLFIRWS